MFFPNSVLHFFVKQLLEGTSYNKYRKYFIVSPASIVSPLESKPVW